MGEDRLYSIIDEHSEAPRIRRVIRGESSFRKEVVSFYEKSRDNIVGYGERFPRDLVETMGCFRGKRFDLEKLDIDAVWEDYARRDRFSYNFVKDVAEFGAVISSIAAGTTFAVVGGAYFFAENPKNIVEGLAIGGIITSVGVYLADLSKRAPKGSNGEWEEYGRLLDTCDYADDFISKKYRAHFIRNLDR